MPNNSGWRGGVRFSKLGEEFDPGLGFLNRPGVNQLNFGTQYTHRPREGLFRSVLSGYNAERIESLDGDLQSQLVRYRLIELENRVGDQFMLEHRAEQEQLYEPFEINDGVIIPVGHYTFDAPRVYVQTADQRKVWGKAAYQTGDFYDGERTEIMGGVNWRPSGRFRGGLEYTFNDIALPEGDFITRLVSLQANVAFSSKLSWTTRIQYDNVSEYMGVNMRLHWIPEAGREAFLVLNHNLEDFDLDNRFHSAMAEATARFSYTFRF
jgi:hypothetical protein